MNTTLSTQAKTYHGLQYRISEDQRSYEIFELTPILKEECAVACGSSVGGYNEIYIKRIIDEMLK